MNEKHCTHCKKLISRPVHPNTKRPFCDSTCYGLWQRGASFNEQGKRSRPKRFCKIDRCSAIHFGKGYCRRHYIEFAYSKPKKARAPKEIRSATCLQCGGEFTPPRSDSKYCTATCMGLHRRRPFIVKKGYRKTLLPTHPRADGKGYVFEHIIIAEAKIGRSLKRTEEVHHMDFNRQNNAPDNLTVCRNHAEHMRYHALRPSGEME